MLEQLIKRHENEKGKASTTTLHRNTLGKIRRTLRGINAFLKSPEPKDQARAKAWIRSLNQYIKNKAFDKPEFDIFQDLLYDTLIVLATLHPYNEKEGDEPLGPMSQQVIDESKRIYLVDGFCWDIKWLARYIRSRKPYLDYGSGSYTEDDTRYLNPKTGKLFHKKDIFGIQNSAAEKNLSLKYLRRFNIPGIPDSALQALREATQLIIVLYKHELIFLLKISQYNDFSWEQLITFDDDKLKVVLTNYFTLSGLLGQVSWEELANLDHDDLVNLFADPSAAERRTQDDSFLGFLDEDDSTSLLAFLDEPLFADLSTARRPRPAEQQTTQNPPAQRERQERPSFDLFSPNLFTTEVTFVTEAAEQQTPEENPEDNLTGTDEEHQQASLPPTRLPEPAEQQTTQNQPAQQEEYDSDSSSRFFSRLRSTSISELDLSFSPATDSTTTPEAAEQQTLEGNLSDTDEEHQQFSFG